VLAGPRLEIERARDLCARRRITAQPVSVSAAFHSPMVAAAQQAFLSALESTELRLTAIPVFANATAQVYPSDAREARELLARQIVEPVEFVAQVEAMYQKGARTFLEVGPDAKLTGLLRSILAGRDHVALAVDGSRGRAGNLYDLACALSTLAALGYPITLDEWDPPAARPVNPRAARGLTARISGANAKPKITATDSRLGSHRAPPPQLPLTPQSEPAVALRFSVAAHDGRLPSQGNQPSTNGFINPTMSTSHPNSAHPTNGQVPSDRDESVSRDEGRLEPASGPVDASHPVPFDLAQAFQTTQDNLIALERLATQRAELHRQFLEGQERIQETFLELLDRRQQLSPRRALSDESRQHPPRPAPIPRSRAASAPGSLPFAPAAGATGPQAHNGEVIPARAPDSAATLLGATSRCELLPAPRDSSLMRSIVATLVEVVADKTGYPLDVLDLDMQLDSDLGIDSIKRVEIFSVLNERIPALAAFKPEELAALGTLRAIAERLATPREPAAHSSCEGGHDHDVLSLANQDGAIAAIVLDAVSDKTGYPPEVLDLDMRLDADLGIDSIKRVEILSALQERLPAIRQATPEQLGTLRTLREIVTFVGQGDLHECGGADQQACVRALGADTKWVAQALLETVADKTGYPTEMLDLDMKLDADLGIDSIKRVEILSAMQERVPAAQLLKPEQLGRLGTLRDIAGALAASDSPIGQAFQPEVRPERPTTCNPAVAPPDALHGGAQLRSAAETTDFRALHDESRSAQHQRAPATERSGARDDGPTTAERVTLAVHHLHAFPLSDPPPGEDVRLPAGGTILIASDGSSVAEALCYLLRSSGYDARVIPVEPRIGATGHERLCGLIILASAVPGEGFISRAFGLLRAAGPLLERSAGNGGAALLTISRLDGRFGATGLAGASDPASGALSGLAKTAALEWPAVHCKAVDLDPAVNDPQAAADLIARELLRRGPVEVGLTARERIGLNLVPEPQSASAAHAKTFSRPSLREGVAGASPAHARKRLASGEPVVISGGARGITASVAVALAQAFQPNLVLFGRTPAPGVEDPRFSCLLTEAALRRGLVECADRRLTPHELSDQARRIMAEREVRQTLARIEAAGSPVTYHALDVRDRGAVQATLQQVRRQHGPIRGLIHGAGVLADRRIIDQTDAQFDLVYTTKVKGFLHLIEELDLESLAFLVLFSSSTARFGRTGQVAYAAANEALNKWAQRLSHQLPACRVVSCNWGPFDGGMVTEALKPLFAREGIVLIRPEDGARLVVDLIQEPADPSAEIVVSAQPQPAGWSPSLAQPQRIVQPQRSCLAAKLEPVIRREVSVKSLPVLASHVIDGHAVLPMVIILEWLAESALQRNPGMVVAGIDDMKLYKGVILSDPPAVTLELRAGKATREDHAPEFRVPVALGGTLVNGREVTHARAEIILADRFSRSAPGLFPRAHPAYPHDRREIYRSLLFHGPAMQGIERVDACDPRGISGWVLPSPLPREWLKRPLRGNWLFDPLAIDCAFQLLVLWCRSHSGANSLPTAIRRYRQYQSRFPADGVRVVAEIRDATAARAVADIELVDAEGKLVARLEGYECVIDPSLKGAFQRNRLSSPPLQRSGDAVESGDDLSPSSAAPERSRIAAPRSPG
jgi:NAD(P)-dependent dehydrogenase (short-subunit alcohol dehydrogenase family)/acyl carrier protein